MARHDSHSRRRRLENRQRQARARRDARSSAGEPELVREVRRRLATGDPLDLLAEASALIASIDERRQSPMQRAIDGERDDLPTPAELVGTLAEIDTAESTALLACFAQLAPDETTRAQARRAQAARRQMLPEWLRRLDRAEAHRCVELSDVLRDGDDIIVAVRLADGHELSALLYVDHNLGTVAKDGFVASEPIDRLLELLGEQAEAEDARIVELDRADARTRITDTIAQGAMTFPPFEGDSWPASRPLIEWVARLLPEGGRSYERPEWSERAQRRLTEDFFASEHGRELDDDDNRSLFESILWYGTDYGPGDPLHWSPNAVEILLLDWIPRKLVAPPLYLAKAPALLAAFIRYAHAQRGIRAARTEETLAALDACAAEYQTLIRSPRPQGPLALLAAIGAIDPDGPWELPGEDQPFDHREHLLGLLRAEVGGPDALAALDDAPLPDEQFAWDGVADDIHARVGEVLAMCDRCSDELLDAEYRTACRRYLALVARGDAEVFRRRGAAHTAAAAVCWTIGTANELFIPSHGGMLVRDLLAHFGIRQGSVSQRAATLLRASGLQSPDRYHSSAWEIRLGTPDLLVAAQRRRIIERRERYAG